MSDRARLLAAAYLTGLLFTVGATPAPLRAQEIAVRLESKRLEQGADFEDAHALYSESAFSPGPAALRNTLPADLHDVMHARIADSPTRFLEVFWGKVRGTEDTLWCISTTRRSSRPCRVYRLGAESDGHLRYAIEVRYVLNNLSRQRVRVRVNLEAQVNPATRTLVYRCNDYRIGEARINGTLYDLALLRRFSALTFRKTHMMSVLIREKGERHFRLRAGVDDAGRFWTREAFPADGPFVIGGVAYEVSEVSADGFRLVMVPSPQKVYAGTGFTMPPLTFETLGGEEVSLADFKGTVTVLVWWHQTCADCLAEIPGLNTLAGSYSGHDDVVFLAATPDGKESLKRFLKEHPFDFRILQSTQQSREVLGAAYPRHMIVDRTGTVIYDEFKTSAGIDRELEAAISACGISR